MWHSWRDAYSQPWSLDESAILWHLHEGELLGVGSSVRDAHCDYHHPRSCRYLRSYSTRLVRPSPHQELVEHIAQTASRAATFKINQFHLTWWSKNLTLSTTLCSALSKSLCDSITHSLTWYLQYSLYCQFHFHRNMHDKGFRTSVSFCIKLSQKFSLKQFL